MRRDLAERFEKVKLLDKTEHIHEHTVSVCQSILDRHGYYTYCETTPVFSIFDKYLTKRKRRSERGIRDIIAFAENNRTLILEVESWKEISESHLDHLLDRIESFRKIPVSVTEIYLILILVWGSNGIKRNILQGVNSRLKEMSNATKSNGKLALVLQPICSHAISLILNTDGSVQLQRHSFFSKGVKEEFGNYL